MIFTHRFKFTIHSDSKHSPLPKTGKLHTIADNIQTDTCPPKEAASKFSTPQNPDQAILACRRASLVAFIVFAIGTGLAAFGRPGFS